MLLLQIVLSLLIIAVILILPGGKGLSRGWGNSGSSFARRGLERLIFRSTFVLLILFVLVSLVQLAA